MSLDPFTPPTASLAEEQMAAPRPTRTLMLSAYYALPFVLSVLAYAALLLAADERDAVDYALVAKCPLALHHLPGAVLLLLLFGFVSAVRAIRRWISRLRNQSKARPRRSPGLRRLILTLAVGFYGVIFFVAGTLGMSRTLQNTERALCGRHPAFDDVLHRLSRSLTSEFTGWVAIVVGLAALHWSRAIWDGRRAVKAWGILAASHGLFIAVAVVVLLVRFR